MLANHWPDLHAASKKVADDGSVARWEILVIDRCVTKCRAQMIFILRLQESKINMHNDPQESKLGGAAVVTGVSLLSRWAEDGFFPSVMERIQ